MEPNNNNNKHGASRSGTLDDEQRIKVLSPGRLVFKRFIRNKLAITGAIFIGIMFVLSFIGGWVMPYGESQVFTKHVGMSKDYAGVSENTEYKFKTVDGAEFPIVAHSQFVLAVNSDAKSMKAQDVEYGITKLADEFYQITKLQEVATATTLLGETKIFLPEGAQVSDTFEAAFADALATGKPTFDDAGITYNVSASKKMSAAYQEMPYALATMNIFDFATEGADPGYNFRFAAETAMHKLGDNGSADFDADGSTYKIDVNDGLAVISTADGNEFANISRYIVRGLYSDVFLTLDFKTQIKELIAAGGTEFKFTDANGKEQEYTIIRNNKQWAVKWKEETLVVDDYASPSSAHLLGTDGNGMDLLTRIMYGGRISLMIGFIVVLIETFLGVILGGVAGFFGKWIDNLIMRIVDIFNCIPSTPLIIIVGAIMDGLRVDPQIRMFYLMMILGILGWPSIARLVRGQILSLREQEFMVAAEATGISISRRIFKHLIPNVIPQLIVVCTMSLGGVILTESTLSFLGLGVKFPFASWGNIINAVSNVHVMTNYWFVWIPAGLCILITVLGFNFIGDGLRDAFDPKMKR